MSTISFRKKAFTVLLSWMEKAVARNHIWQQQAESKQRNSVKAFVSKSGRPLSVRVCVPYVPYVPQ